MKRLSSASILLAFCAVQSFAQSAKADQPSYGECINGMRQVRDMVPASQSVLGYVLPKVERVTSERCNNVVSAKEQEAARKRYDEMRHPTGLSKTESVCYEQAVLIDQTYDLYRAGESEEGAFRRQVGAGASKSTQAWMKKTIRGIFSDPRSAYVDTSLTTSLYQQNCLKNPSAYVRDMSLLK